ncbi:shikimate kinase [Anoxybacterium hadale]|uniref:Shikimate kinase n=1 Tax=Anoxybacterium hadale TaxID=3408580 RepID=A0ACD1AG15_9FIRM|nr:shikimate kinase [Clostridiales bacterium]
MKNIVLIGMPGCGKSTVGVILAKIMGFHFIDADLLIQEREGKLLTEILEDDGPEAFNQIENEVNLQIGGSNTVVATGGSVVYGKEAMEHYRETAIVVYLQLPFDEIECRLGDITERGISMKEGQTLRTIYEERIPLYEQYGHLKIDTLGLDIKDAAQKIKETVKLSMPSS